WNSSLFLNCLKKSFGNGVWSFIINCIKGKKYGLKFVGCPPVASFRSAPLRYASLHFATGFLFIQLPGFIQCILFYHIVFSRTDSSALFSHHSSLALFCHTVSSSHPITKTTIRRF